LNFFFFFQIRDYFTFVASAFKIRSLQCYPKKKQGFLNTFYFEIIVAIELEVQNQLKDIQMQVRDFNYIEHILRTFFCMLFLTVQT